IPAQIPVEAAMRIIVEQGKQRTESVYDAAAKIRLANNAGANIFNDVTNNDIRALATLTDTNEWKGSEEKFVNIIVNNVNSNGFNEKVFYLSKNDWNELYNYLSSIL